MNFKQKLTEYEKLKDKVPQMRFPVNKQGEGEIHTTYHHSDGATPMLCILHRPGPRQVLAVCSERSQQTLLHHLESQPHGKQLI